MTYHLSAAEVAAEPGPSRRAEGRGGEAILIVEDEPEVARVMGELLHDEGYDVLLAGDGKEALERLEDRTVDLIVLDLRMPVMDGWRFRTVQRAHPRLAAIPVIAVSADGSPQAEAIDADYYLRKPFQPDQLLVAVERVLLEQRRRQVEETLKQTQLLTTLGTIAASVGHEINNPLTYVLGNVELMQSRLAGAVDPASAGLVGELTDLLGDIRIGAERIRAVVATLQALSRQSEVPFSLVDVNEVVRTSVAMVSNEIRHRAPLRVELQAVPPVAGDAMRLGQVMLNLLVNAAQSIPSEAYASNEIVVSTAAAGELVTIEVSDTGVGIPAELQPRVFDPFFTTKGRFKGTGIGLTVCRDIINEHGGSIALDSLPGSGTTFRVSLPAQRLRGPRAEGGADRTGADAVRSDPAFRSTRVLAIDDDSLVLSTTERILSQEHMVDKAPSAREGLRALASGRVYQAILCDVMMPDMNGIQFWREVQRRYPGLETRIVFMTGAALVAEVQSFRERSPNLWLEKPFSVEELLVKVREVVWREVGGLRPS